VYHYLHICAQHNQCPLSSPPNRTYHAVSSIVVELCHEHPIPARSSSGAALCPLSASTPPDAFVQPSYVYTSNPSKKTPYFPHAKFPTHFRTNAKPNPKPNNEPHPRPFRLHGTLRLPSRSRRQDEQHGYVQLYVSYLTLPFPISQYGEKKRIA
jgi:hypothetical protein